MYLYLIAFGCLCTGDAVLDGVDSNNPTASTTGAGQSACNPLFDFTVFLRAADTFYVRREKRRQMQSQYEIRAFIIEGCSGLFFAIGAFEPYRLADLRQIPIQHHPLAPYLVNLTLDRLQFHNSTILFLESLFSIQRANNFLAGLGLKFFPSSTGNLAAPVCNLLAMLKCFGLFLL